jgi:hypothetical protein
MPASTSASEKSLRQGRQILELIVVSMQLMMADAE